MFTSRLLLAAVAVTAVAAQNPLSDISAFIAIINSSNSTCSGRPACSGLATAAPPCYGIINDQTSEANCICTPAGALAFESCARCVAEDSCAVTGNAPLLLVPQFVNHCLPYVNGTVQESFQSISAELVTSVTTTGVCSTKPTATSASIPAISSAFPEPTPAPESSTPVPAPASTTSSEEAPAPSTDAQAPTSSEQAPATATETTAPIASSENASAPTTSSEEAAAPSTDAQAPTISSTQAPAPSPTTLVAPIQSSALITTNIFVFPSDAPPIDVPSTISATPTQTPIQTRIVTSARTSTTTSGPLLYARWLAQH